MCIEVEKVSQIYSTVHKSEVVAYHCSTKTVRKKGAITAFAIHFQTHVLWSNNSTISSWKNASEASFFHFPQQTAQHRPLVTLCMTRRGLRLEWWHRLYEVLRCSSTRTHTVTHTQNTKIQHCYYFDSISLTTYWLLSKHAEGHFLASVSDALTVTFKGMLLPTPEPPHKKKSPSPHTHTYSTHWFTLGLLKTITRVANTKCIVHHTTKHYLTSLTLIKLIFDKRPHIGQCRRRIGKHQADVASADTSWRKKWKAF